MPHIPRSMAPSGLVDPSTVPRAARKAPGKTKPPVPYMGSGKGEINPTSKLTQKNPLVKKLSMKDWDVDPLQVLKHLSDKEYKVDEHSGLVSDTE